MQKIFNISILLFTLFAVNNELVNFMNFFYQNGNGGETDFM